MAGFVAVSVVASGLVLSGPVGAQVEVSRQDPDATCRGLVEQGDSIEGEALVEVSGVFEEMAAKVGLIGTQVADGALTPKLARRAKIEVMWEAEDIYESLSEQLGALVGDIDEACSEASAEVQGEARAFFTTLQDNVRNAEDEALAALEEIDIGDQVEPET